MKGGDRAGGVENQVEKVFGRVTQGTLFRATANPKRCRSATAVQDAGAFIKHPSNSASFWSAVAGAQRRTPLSHAEAASQD